MVSPTFPFQLALLNEMRAMAGAPRAVGLAFVPRVSGEGGYEQGITDPASLAQAQANCRQAPPQATGAALTETPSLVQVARPQRPMETPSLVLFTARRARPKTLKAPFV